MRVQVQVQVSVMVLVQEQRREMEQVQGQQIRLPLQQDEPHLRKTTIRESQYNSQRHIEALSST